MSSFLPDIDPDNVPAHVAIVMDGNGRWATQRGLQRTDGHAAGEEALADTGLRVLHRELAPARG